MRQLIMLSILGFAASACRADDDSQTAPLPAQATAPATAPVPKLVPVPAWSPRPPRARAVPAPGVLVAASANASAPAGEPAKPVEFASEGKWDLAGYNNDEIIYTIFITSHDPRIIRCVTQLSGFYYENGEKHSVSDRQSTTVFPDQRVQAGNWQGMDEKSGATYSVKCRPV
jgi:hypothetical protein